MYSYIYIYSKLKTSVNFENYIYVEELIAKTKMSIHFEYYIYIIFEISKILYIYTYIIFEIYRHFVFFY